MNRDDKDYSLIDKLFWRAKALGTLILIQGALMIATDRGALVDALIWFFMAIVVWGGREDLKKEYKRWKDERISSLYPHRKRD